MFSKAAALKNVFSKVKEDFSDKVSSSLKNVKQLVQTTSNSSENERLGPQPEFTTLGKSDSSRSIADGTMTGDSSDQGQGFDHVILYSGCGVIKRYEHEWNEIHRGNVECFERGKTAGEKMDEYLRGFEGERILQL